MMTPMFGGFSPAGKLYVETQDVNPARCWKKLKQRARVNMFSTATCKQLGYRVKQTGRIAL
ncbi:MAG: hypothetical protein ACRCZI_09795 [Cetobacterium sp.]